MSLRVLFVLEGFEALLVSVGISYQLSCLLLLGLGVQHCVELGLGCCLRFWVRGHEGSGVSALGVKG